MSIKPSAKPQVTSWGAGYEPSDISVGWLAGVLAFMALAALTIHLLLGGLVKTLRARPAPQDQNWVSKPAQKPPESRGPRLQVAPVRDLKEFREREALEMKTYGWADKASKTVRLPLDRAIELALSKGFPVRDASSNTTGPSSLQLQQERAK
jgi:hypothetical protein